VPQAAILAAFALRRKITATANLAIRLLLASAGLEKTCVSSIPRKWNAIRIVAGTVRWFTGGVWQRFAGNGGWPWHLIHES
jgi:hypothetical protein